MEEFIGSAGFDPGSEADDGFGVFAKPVGGVAFDSQVDHATHRAFDAPLQIGK